MIRTDYEPYFRMKLQKTRKFLPATPQKFLLLTIGDFGLKSKFQFWPQNFAVEDFYRSIYFKNYGLKVQFTCLRLIFRNRVDQNPKVNCILEKNGAKNSTKRQHVYREWNMWKFKNCDVLWGYFRQFTSDSGLCRVSTGCQIEDFEHIYNTSLPSFNDLISADG